MTFFENPTEVLHIPYGNNFPLVKYPFNVTFIFYSILLKVKISPLKSESLTHTKKKQNKPTKKKNQKNVDIQFLNNCLFFDKHVFKYLGIRLKTTLIQIKQYFIVNKSLSYLF